MYQDHNLILVQAYCPTCKRYRKILATPIALVIDLTNPAPANTVASCSAIFATSAGR